MPHSPPHDTAVGRDVMARSMETCSQCSFPVPERSHFCPRCGASTAGLEVEELLASAASDPTGLLDQLRRATAGEFTIIRELGRGGMGRVYLAHEITLDRRVAMKVLPPALVEHRQIVQRFQREARTAGKLSHPNIVAVFQVTERAGLYFFTMPYVAGPSLRQILRQTPQLDFELCRRYLREAADALSYAHAQGVVHRDIKPENMLLEGSRDGRLLLTDFGIAKALGAATSITRPGDMMGTPYYMSPEVCQELETVDGRSDQYSLGLVAYEMLAGRFPFSADSLAGIVYKQLHEQLEPLEQIRPDLPSDLGRVIARATRKDPNERFPTMASFMEPLGQPGPSAQGVTVKRARRARPLRWGSGASRRWLGAAGLTLVLTAAALILWQRSERSGVDDARLAESALPSQQPGAPATDVASGESAPGSTVAEEEHGGESEGGSGPRSRPVSGEAGGSPGVGSEARSDPLARDREEVTNMRRQAERALQSARSAGAERHFAEEYTALAGLFSRADADLTANRLISAARGFTAVSRDLEALAARARAAERELEMPQPATRPSGADSVELGAERLEGTPGVEEGGVIAPEQAINRLLEVYRKAFELEDLGRISAEVYRGDIPESDDAFLRQWFDGASEFQVALELEELAFPEEGVARAQIRQTMKYKLARFGWDRSWEGVLRLSFAGTDGEWRLVRLEAPR